ncbi:branched-chain alpha-keto acid dehydrogenase subunit E2 [Halorhodospira abdelmalekii]|nr:branched-chain alpha-keto acid dehydrogenase subunit E2 [Halorhodospira abdelmalekii]
MVAIEEVKVPDIGDFDEVEIIEVLVAPGDRIEPEQSLITLESDKASMEVPATLAGVVQEIKVAVGDRVSAGSLILTVESEAGAGGDSSADSGAAVESRSTPAASATAAGSGAGSDTAADAGEAGGGATAVRSAAASGPDDSSSSGAPSGSSGDGAAAAEAGAAASASTTASSTAQGAVAIDRDAHRAAHASPAVRRFARELGVDLGQVSGSGRKGRIRKEDVKAHVKQVLRGEAAAGAVPGAASGAAGSGIPPLPQVDFSQFGETEQVPLTRIQRLSGPHLHRSWLNVPHVTQFDEADATELEAFRHAMKGEAEQRGVKLTPLAFLVKAASAALAEMPRFNASLAADGENLILKKYCHIGVAVDTPGGLVVPVLRDVDRKGVWEIAAELGTLSSKAREGKLAPGDMQGGCFTISSLGGIGGTAFTPIVNAPEVAILGVSRSQTKPVWNGQEFVPRLMLPLSLSYDHRVIDGAMAARFTTYLARLIGDLRRLVL